MLTPAVIALIVSLDLAMVSLKAHAATLATLPATTTIAVTLDTAPLEQSLEEGITFNPVPLSTDEDYWIDKIFPDVPIMHKVAECESGKRQAINGKVVIGRITPDRGLFQISPKHWLAESKRLGLNIDTLEGNVRMARVIYNAQGLNAWKPSKFCWSKGA